MTRSIRILLLLTTLLAGAAWAQTCVNHISVDGEWLKGPGFAGQAACYFLDHGDSGNAFTPASLLADAMGLELGWDEDSKTVVFHQGATIARLAATSDIDAGLRHTRDNFTVNGAPFGRPVPSAILVGGTSWVPVGSIADAFGATSPYDPDSHVIFIETAAFQARVAAARAAAEAAAQDDPLPAGAPEPENLRVAYHGGFTRIVIDIPPGTDYQVTVRGHTLAVVLPGMRADPFRLRREGNPHLQDLWYGIIGGKLALVADTSFELSAGGRGYRYDVLPPEQDGQDARLYVDLGPTLQGEPVTTLAATPRPLPAQAAAPEPQARQVALRRTPKPTIVLDPGHGGKFAGARGIGGIKEEVLVLQIAFKVKALLESRGYKVVMTRTTDTQLSLNYDEDLVSRANFATAERNLFVSIHANTAANPAGHGIETYVFGKPLNNDTLKAAIRENGGGDDNVGRAVTDTALAFATGLDGDLLAQEILHFSRMLAQSVQSSLVAGTGAGDRGVKQAPYRVLTQSRIPAILVEVGFMTNPTEGPKLVQDSYQDKIAAGIARGIFSFFESNGSVAAR